MKSLPEKQKTIKQKNTLFHCVSISEDSLSLSVHIYLFTLISSLEDRFFFSVGALIHPTHSLFRCRDRSPRQRLLECCTAFAFFFWQVLNMPDKRSQGRVWNVPAQLWSLVALNTSEIYLGFQLSRDW